MKNERLSPAMEAAINRARRQIRLDAENDDDDEEVYRRYSENPSIQAFFEDHGKFIRSNRNELLFEDGARIESGSWGYGSMKPPPESKYELAKLRCQYLEILCKLAEKVFRSYRDALAGESAEVSVNIREVTDAEQLAKLKKLKIVATKARTRLKKARERLEDVTPAWVHSKKRQEAENQRQKTDLKRRARDIRL